MRKCLVEEFSSLYVFHLRGNARTSGELRRREKDNVFGQGTRTPVAISILVKNPQSQDRGKIRFHDIGDYLTTAQKLEKIARLRSVAGISEDAGWQAISPDEHGDWFNKRDSTFLTFIAAGGREIAEDSKIFKVQSGGIKSNRDTWAFNRSRTILESNVRRSIDFYNSERLRLQNLETSSLADTQKNFETNNDPKSISWTRGLRERLQKGRKLTFSPDASRKALYRPFTREWVYLDSSLIEVMSKIPAFFRDGKENIVIWTTGIGATVPYSCWISNEMCGLQQGPAAVQHFPLYLYERTDEASDTELFSKGGGGEGGYTRRDAITDGGLEHFRAAYGKAGAGITKEDLFYYIYGLLHSPEYRSRYADNLSKELPRIPAVKKFADFMAYSKAGRELADWHLNYETSAVHPDIVVDQVKTPATESHRYRVEKMKYGKKKDPETNKNVPDKTTVIYNPHITLRNIPLEAYDYVVNGKPALDWVMERQSVKTDKASGIVNDANDWATETMGDAKYPMELFLRVAQVSVETVKIVNGLPKLEIN